MLACIGTVVSCTKKEEGVTPDPVVKNALAKYTATVDPTDAFTYSFKNQSEGYKRLEWRFGDDTLTTVVDPVHTYLNTGKFTVDLKAFSETNNESRRFYDINIQPDTILKIVPTKTAVAGESKYTLSTKFPLKSADWTFKDVIPNKTFKTDGAVPQSVNYSLIPDNIHTITVTAKSTKGSTVTVTKPNTTAEGYVLEVTQQRTSVTINPAGADNASSSTENFTKLFDGNRLTKMYKGGFRGAFINQQGYFEMTFDTPQKCIFYAVGNANDSPERDPKSWNIQGSLDGVTWTVLDTRTIAKNFKDQWYAKLPSATDNDNESTGWKNRIWYFGIKNGAFYKYYRWYITDLWSGDNFQSGEFKLYKQQ